MVIRRPSQSPPEAYAAPSVRLVRRSLRTPRCPDQPATTRSCLGRLGCRSQDPASPTSQRVARLDQLGDPVEQLTARLPVRRSPPPGRRSIPRTAATLRARRGKISIGHAVADPKAGKPIRLGEGPEHHDVRPSDRGTPDRAILRVGDELHVRLIENDHDVIRNRVDEVDHLLMLQRRARRVVRRTEHDRLGSRGDRPPHRIKIMNSAGTQRHRHRGRAGHRYRDRIRLEAAPRVDHLIAGLTGGLQQVVQHRHRAGAEGKLLGGHAEPTAQRVRSSQRWQYRGSGSSRGHRGGGGLNDARKRWVRVFVAATA